MKNNIDKRIEGLEAELKELKELREKYIHDPIMELEDRVSEMRFMNKYSTRMIIDYIQLWIKQQQQHNGT